MDTCGITKGSSQADSMYSIINELCHSDVLIHVIRGYENENITHYYETVDCVRDFIEVDNEILLRVFNY